MIDKNTLTWISYFGLTCFISIWKCKKQYKAGKMAQWGKVLATNRNSTPGSHMVEGENRLLKFSCDFPTCAMALGTHTDVIRNFLKQYLQTPFAGGRWALSTSRGLWTMTASHSLCHASPFLKDELKSLCNHKPE